MTQVFMVDGIAYNVDVLSLIRKFSVMDTDKSGRTQDGQMYRDVVGTFYNYTITVGVRGNDVQALEAFRVTVDERLKLRADEVERQRKEREAREEERRRRKEMRQVSAK